MFGFALVQSCCTTANTDGALKGGYVVTQDSYVPVNQYKNLNKLQYLHLYKFFQKQKINT